MVRILLIIIGLVLALPVVMTSVICHPRFLWAWKMNGQCAASDTPSEVFVSFLIISAIFWALLFAIGFAARSTT